MREKILNYIAEWEKRCYKDGIPDEAPLRLEQLNKVPSYKAIARAIMKNDTTLKSIGFTQKKCNSYHELKRIELTKTILMNVYLETQKRLKLLFDEFDNIYVSFSGGKDSGVLLNLCIDYIRQNKLDRKIGVFHLDYEAQYTYTTEYVNRTLAENLDILEIYRCCIPFKVTTCTSMYENHWRPWEADKKDIWVSELPENCYTESDFDFYKPNMWDYEFQEKFSQWIHKKTNAKKTACLVGIRTQESLNRWRAIHSERNYKNYEGINWTKKMYPNVFNAYPIYDWITEDIWVANGKFGWTYNKLYDIYYQAGVTIDQMRVASPFLSTAQDSLKLYRIIEPRTWGKLIGRVNGVNFTGIYGGTTAMGWREIKLPKGHTWKSYMEFLLSTLPEHSAENYKKVKGRKYSNYRKGVYKLQYN